MSAPGAARTDWRAIPRDGNGYPRDRKLRYEHLLARNKWVNDQLKDTTFAEAGPRMARHDREDPWFLVEWSEAQG